MPLLNAVKEEFSRAPVASISGAFGVLIAGISLVLAWLQFQNPTPSTPLSSGGKPALGLNISNLMLLISYFIATTTTTAIALRVAARKNDLAAFFASIPVLALTNFSTILVIYLAPPRQFDQSAFTSAHDLVFYGAAAIVITFCGRAVMSDLVGPTTSNTEKSSSDYKAENSQALGGIFLAIIVMAVWGKLVFAGQVRLTKTLLPDITHPIEFSPQATEPQKSNSGH